jgi:hypothetical protein
MLDLLSLADRKKATTGRWRVACRFGLRTMILAAALTLTGCSNPASTPRGNLEVLVCDVMSQPLTGIHVTLNPEGTFKDTNDNGRVVFNGLPPGEYQIRVGSTAFETHLETVIVEEGQTTCVEVTLNGKPAGLNVRIRLSGIGMAGVTVRVKRKLNGSEMSSGISGTDGLVQFEGLAAQPVTVVADSLDNLYSTPLEVELVGLQTSLATVYLNRWSTLFKGVFGFPNDDPHQVTLMELTGSTLVPVLAPVYFSGTYRLFTMETGDLVVLQYGNPGPFEMATVFSPVYSVTDLTNINVPLQDCALGGAIPRDDTPFYTTQLPISLHCACPLAWCIYLEWNVVYWKYEGDVWNLTPVQYYAPSSYTTEWWWDGSISNASSLFGQTLPASAEGEYYSWYVMAAYSTGMLCFTPDYFFLLRTPPAASARPVAGSRIGTVERSELERRLDEIRLERAASVLERLGRVPPRSP